MNSKLSNGLLKKDSMVRQLLQPLDQFLKMGGITEIAINRPNEAWIETNQGWQKHELPDFGMQEIKALANVIATYTEQRIGEENPILSAQLPDGERIQIVLPPAIEQKHCINDDSYSRRKQ